MAMIEAGGDGQWVDDGQQPARDRATEEMKVRARARERFA